MSSIVETPMQPVKLDKLCDHCRAGLMNCVGENMGKFVHQCPDCKFSELHEMRYPYLTFKEIEQ